MPRFHSFLPSPDVLDAIRDGHSLRVREFYMRAADLHTPLAEVQAELTLTWEPVFIETRRGFLTELLPRSLAIALSDWVVRDEGELVKSYQAWPGQAETRWSLACIEIEHERQDVTFRFWANQVKRGRPRIGSIVSGWRLPESFADPIRWFVAVEPSRE